MGKIDGSDHKNYLKREMKDGVDHCGHCNCGDCHYDCDKVGELDETEEDNLEEEADQLWEVESRPQTTPSSLRNSEHRRRRRSTPTPIPSDCPCEHESGLDTTTRRRQFKSALPPVDQQWWLDSGLSD